ncbi:MAG: trypsin-like peptidase domain-containing protein [Pelatocladus maniniholoensis HA4357-MV3]|jgi:serine protease Do|uniref:Trypsin-like peptidase domain-containing protein n=1 Tax=Pelatocladus maniniholoensis HA4357-MV3 TaxID=1117104 RepID=A0A9E3H554_9NOST|nr:trypsin-like peptidase domain-containing protein [Pelatocladus maniniholoensis HA4357-MV3]BAZ65458.1 peptidase S1 and S6 chymotrypsin/Hap [Fischerella sp. NIES-4106]
MANTIFTDITVELATLSARLRNSTVKVKSGSLGSGSGIIWQSDGLIITNAHVTTSNRVTVELPDGRVFDAARTHFDPQQDLAALKIAATDLTAAIIGDSEALRVGELVLAVGNPFGENGTVTTGIIYASNRRVVMADLRLYPGNSGGPLADSCGRVIGINTMIANGLAVAIPISSVDRFLRDDRPPQLGVTLQTVVLNRRSLGLLVLSISPGSAAEIAGMQIGDVLIGVGGRLFTKPNDLAKYLNHSHPNESLPLQVWRGGQQFVVYVELHSKKTARSAK